MLAAARMARKPRIAGSRGRGERARERGVCTVTLGGRTEEAQPRDQCAVRVGSSTLAAAGACAGAGLSYATGVSASCVAPSAG